MSKSGSCCGDASKSEATDNNMIEFVAKYYGQVLARTRDLKTSACTSASRPHHRILECLEQVPAGVRERYYGCGTAIPLGIGAGQTLLDLGCGSGQDCYCAAALGADVIGVDMTAEQLNVARAHVDEFEKRLGRSVQMRFEEAYIEDLHPVASESVDVCISNCVLNLSPRKDAVLREVWRVLRPGGEFYFSDVYCDRRLDETVRSHEVLWGECIAGALYENDFLRLCREVGFADPRQMERTSIEVTDPALLRVTGNARFFSVTYRLFKLEELESLCEDYGQVAVYSGTIDGMPHAYRLDDHHIFYRGKPALVCGNTASMLADSWLGKHFTVTGDRSVHYGEFPCGPEPGTTAAAPSAAPNKGCC